MTVNPLALLDALPKRLALLDAYVEGKVDLDDSRMSQIIPLWVNEDGSLNHTGAHVHAHGWNGERDE